jgi:hypothetical protein
LDSWTGNAWDVSVSLAWSDMGTNTHERLNFHFRDQTCITQTPFKGAFREAEVTGSVSDGITNFTPEQSVRATLISSNSSEMVINCDEEWIRNIQCLDRPVEQIILPVRTKVSEKKL